MIEIATVELDAATTATTQNQPRRYIHAGYSPTPVSERKRNKNSHLRAVLHNQERRQGTGLGLSTVYGSSNKAAAKSCLARATHGPRSNLFSVVAEPPMATRPNQVHARPPAARNRAAGRGRQAYAKSSPASCRQRLPRARSRRRDEALAWCEPRHGPNPW
jgi:hypothetical protein